MTLYLLLAISCSNVLYLYIPSGSVGFTWLLAIYALQGSLLWATSVGIKKYEFPPMMLVFALAVFARFITCFSDPIFENDYYRYLWDGRVLANGFNPYSYPPTSELLDGLDVWYREKIGFLHLRTIYPPVSEILFAGNYILFGDSLFALKSLFICFDLATGYVILYWLKLINRPTYWVILYLFHPVAFKEIANSGHLDSIMVFFSVLSMYLLQKEILLGKGSGSWVAMAISALSKVTSLALTPILLRLSPRKINGSLLLIILCAAFILPFWMTGTHFMAGMGAFSKYWTFNETVFYAISNTVNAAISFFKFDESVWMVNAVINQYPGRFVCGLLFLAFVAYRTATLNIRSSISREAMLIMATLLLLSPVYNAWYSLWYLPFAVVCGSISATLLAGLSVMAYAWFYDKDLHRYFWTLEYIIFFAFVAYRIWGKNRISKKGVQNFVSSPNRPRDSSSNF